MTRRWFLKLVSALAPLFGVKAETGAESVKQTYTGVQRKWEIAAPPPMSELEARCRVPGTLTAAVLNEGCVYRPNFGRNVLDYIERNDSVQIEEAPTFTMHARLPWCNSLTT